MSTPDSGHRETNPPKLWHYVSAAVFAIFVVTLYGYSSWTVIGAPRILKEWGLRDLDWVSVETTPTANADSGIAKSSSEELRAKLLDLRGKLGDSFGPVNALLSSLGFIALLYSINLQRAATAQQQKASAEVERTQQRQRFEELFSLTVTASRDAAKEIEWQEWVNDNEYVAPKHLRMVCAPYEVPKPKKAGTRWAGKGALLPLWENEIESPFYEEIVSLQANPLAAEIAAQFNVHNSSGLDNNPNDPSMAVPFVRQAFCRSDWPDREYVFHHLVRTYKAIYRNNEYQLDAYFRTVYRVFELLSRGERDYALTRRQIREYAAIARAQLSWHELAIILFNCVADDFPRAGKLYNFFALFDNLSTRSSIVTTLLQLYVESSKQGANELAKPGVMSELSAAAFSTDVARNAYDSK